MSVMSKYLTVTEKRIEGRKTPIITVQNAISQEKLCTIEWVCPFRKMGVVTEPKKMGFDQNCWDEIGELLKKSNQRRKYERRTKLGIMETRKSRD